MAEAIFEIWCNEVNHRGTNQIDHVTEMIYLSMQFLSVNQKAEMMISKA